jgi:hypothetical protein
MTVLVSNTGMENTTSLGVCLVYPNRWTLFPEGSMPYALNATKEGLLLPPSSAGTVHDQNSAFTLSPLQSNETEFMQFTVNVPIGTTPGSYTLFALVNSTTSNAQGTLVMTVQSQASLPLGGVLIPVSLVLILLPGFVTVLIILWMNRALSSSWQTGLVAVLFSLFFGVTEWMHFFQEIPSLHGISASIIFNLDPSIIPLTYFEWVGIWSIIIGFVAGGLVLGLILLRNWIADAWHRSDHWPVVFLREHAESKDPTWVAVLRKSLQDAVVLHGRGWYPQVKVTLSTSPAGDGKPNPPPAPAVTTQESANTTKVISTDKTVKDKETVVEKVDTTTSTTQKPADGKKEDKSVLVGLLKRFDDVSPFDIAIAPQYFITLDAKGWQEYARKYPPSKAVIPVLSEEMKSKHVESLSRDLNGIRDPREIERRISWVLENGGTKKVRQDQGNYVDSQEWIRGSTIQALEILDPKRQYVFELAP